MISTMAMVGIAIAVIIVIIIIIIVASVYATQGGGSKDSDLEKHNRELFQDGQVLNAIKEMRTNQFLVNGAADGFFWTGSPNQGYLHKIIKVSGLGYVILATGSYTGNARRVFFVNKDGRVSVRRRQPTSRDTWRLSDDGTKLIHEKSGKALAKSEDGTPVVVDPAKAPKIMLVD